MSERIDEAAAWGLVRALRPGSVPASGSARVEGGDGIALDIDNDGGWRAGVGVDGDARDVLDIYLPLRVPETLVIGQLGQSLDGRIATESGASHFVTGPEDIVRLHRLRALVDAVLIGATTAVSDNPRLTVRHVEGRNPVRVVLDPSERVGRELHMRTDGASRTIVVRRAAEGVSDAELISDGVLGEVLYVPMTGDGRLDLVALLRALRAEGLARVLVEGGGVTVSRFLEADLLDRLHVSVAPMLIGSGRPSLTLEAITSLDDAIRPACRHFMLGADALFDLDFRGA